MATDHTTARRKTDQARQLLAEPCHLIAPNEAAMIDHQDVVAALSRPITSLEEGWQALDQHASSPDDLRPGSPACQCSPATAGRNAALSTASIRGTGPSRSADGFDAEAAQ